MTEPRRPNYRVHLRLDGKPSPLKPFIHDVLGGGIVGMLSALKGTEDAHIIEIKVERRDLGQRSDDSTS